MAFRNPTASLKEYSVELGEGYGEPCSKSVKIDNSFLKDRRYW